MEHLKLVQSRSVCNCLKIIGNLCSFYEHLCGVLIQNGLLEVLKRVIKEMPASVGKDGYWVLSNIVANSEKEAKQVVDSGMISTLMINALMPN